MSGQEEIIQTNNSGKVLQHVTIPCDQPAKGEHLAYFWSGWKKKNIGQKSPGVQSFCFNGYKTFIRVPLSTQGHRWLIVSGTRKTPPWFELTVLYYKQVKINIIWWLINTYLIRKSSNSGSASSIMGCRNASILLVFSIVPSMKSLASVEKKYNQICYFSNSLYQLLQLSEGKKVNVEICLTFLSS